MTTTRLQRTPKRPLRLKVTKGPGTTPGSGTTPGLPVKPHLKVTAREGQPVNIQPNGTQWISVSCNKDEVVVGGGYNLAGHTKDLRVTGESKTGNGWGIRAANYSTATGEFTPIAMCAKLVLA